MHDSEPELVLQCFVTFSKPDSNLRPLPQCCTAEPLPQSIRPSYSARQPFIASPRTTRLSRSKLGPTTARRPPRSPARSDRRLFFLCSIVFPQPEQQHGSMDEAAARAHLFASPAKRQKLCFDAPAKGEAQGPMPVTWCFQLVLSTARRLSMRTAAVAARTQAASAASSSRRPPPPRPRPPSSAGRRPSHARPALGPRLAPPQTTACSDCRRRLCQPTCCCSTSCLVSA